MNRLLPILLLLACQAHAGAGKTSEAFLKIGVGARPTGMGNAFTAVANDINAITWNPAGLSQLSKRELGVMHAELFADTRYDFIGYAHPMLDKARGQDYGTLGLGLQRLSHETIEARGPNREAAGGFSGSDMALNLAYSRALNSSLRLGANMKYLSSRIESESAQGFALDLGGMYRVPGRRGLMFGAAVQNLGPGVRFIDQTDPLPLTLALGAGYQLGSGLLFALDVKNRINEGATEVSVGTEYAVFSGIALRAGYLSALAGDAARQGSGAAKELGSLSGLGAGVGLRLSGYTLDYAFTPFGELGTVQRISLGARF